MEMVNTMHHIVNWIVYWYNHSETNPDIIIRIFCGTYRSYGLIAQFSSGNCRVDSKSHLKKSRYDLLKGFVYVRCYSSNFIYTFKSRVPKIACCQEYLVAML